MDVYRGRDDGYFLEFADFGKVYLKTPQYFNDFFLNFAENSKKIENENFGCDLNLIADAFDIQRVEKCEHLDSWMATTYDLTDFENEIIDQLHADMSDFGDYLNEEELKIQFVGSAFLVARVNVPHKIRIFYERGLSATVNNYELFVISDCLIASPKRFNAPQRPYFFLQEFKKDKGEKLDPEAQMMVAMLIAQEKNQDNYPIYGGYLVGRNWIFTTLLANNYYVSRQFDATKRADICQIIFNLRQIKAIVLNFPSIAISSKVSKQSLTKAGQTISSFLMPSLGMSFNLKSVKGVNHGSRPKRD